MPTHPSPHPHSNTKIIPNTFTQTHNIVNQRSSQTLLLNLLNNLAILYLVMTILSTPIWVMSGIAFLQMEQNNYNQVDKLDYLLIFTSGHLRWLEKTGQNSKQLEQIADINSKISINSINSNNNKKIVSDGVPFINPQIINNTAFQRISLSSSPNKDSMSASQYLSICLWIDCILQIIFIIGCSILQYISFKFKQKHKGNHIEDYTLEVTGLPLIQPYVLLPKLEQFLISNLTTKFQMVTDNIEIFDIVSAYAEQRYRELVLRNELNLRLSQQQCHLNLEQIDNQQSLVKDRIKQVKEMLFIIDTKHAKKDTIWITFQTRQARYLAFRLIQSKSNKFMNYFLHVQKAPHPSQIIWSHLHTYSIIVLGSQLLSLVICMGFLLLFDLLILYIHKQQYNIIISSFTIFILQVVLKQIIIMSVTKLQKHKYMSKMSLSLLCKLSKFLYINTALIIFISSFDIGMNSFAKTFSTRFYKKLDLSWFKHVGLSIMLNFIIQIIYLNIRPTIQIIKHHIITKLIQIIKTRKIFSSPDDKLNKQTKLKSQLDICYAHIISVVMFANTFSFTHPIFYPLSAVCMFIAIYSHRKYIAHFTQPAPHNNDDLNDTAIQYIYASIILHWILLFIGYEYLLGLILGCIGFGILLFKNTLITKISDSVRRKLGPFCFSQFQCIHVASTPLLSLLNTSQISQYILYLQNKIKIYTNIYNSKSQKSDLIQKSYLRHCIRTIQSKIIKLQNLKQNIHLPEKDQKQQNIDLENKKNKFREIKGNFYYQIPQKLINT